MSSIKETKSVDAPIRTSSTPSIQTVQGHAQVPLEKRESSQTAGGRVTRIMRKSFLSVSTRFKLGTDHDTTVKEIREFGKNFDTCQDNGRRRQTRLRKFAEMIMRGYTYSVISLLLVNISVFGQEIGLLAIPKNLDWIVHLFTVVALFFFTIDMLLLCYVRSDYFLSSLFWLDVVSIISLLPDIEIVSDFIASQLSVSKGNSAVSISRFAAVAARTGSRVTKSLRVIRMLRIIRLARLFRLFTQVNKRSKVSEHQDTGASFGKGIAEESLKKVIVTVLMVLLVFPLLEVDDASASPYEIYGLRQLDSMSREFGHNSTMFQRIYDHFTTYETDIEILKLEVQGRVFIYQLKSIEQLRTSDILRIYELDSTCWLDMRNIGRREAIMTIFKSLILIFILAILSISFTRQMRREVSAPVVKLIKAMSVLSIGQAHRIIVSNRGSSDQHEVNLLTQQHSTTGVTKREGSSVLDNAVQNITKLLRGVERFMQELIPVDILRQIKSLDNVMMETYTNSSVLVCNLAYQDEMIDILEESTLKSIISTYDSIVESAIAEAEGVFVLRCTGFQYAVVAGCPKTCPNPTVTLVELANNIRIKLASEQSFGILSVCIGIDSGEVRAGIFSPLLRFHVFGSVVDRATTLARDAPSQTSVYLTLSAVEALAPDPEVYGFGHLLQVQSVQRPGKESKPIQCFELRFLKNAVNREPSSTSRTSNIKKLFWKTRT